MDKKADLKMAEWDSEIWVEEECSLEVGHHKKVVKASKMTLVRIISPRMNTYILMRSKQPWKNLDLV